MTKSRNINRPKWKPDAVALELVRRNFATSRTQDIADALGVAPHQVWKLARKLGLEKCPEYLATPAGGRFNGEQGQAGRFKKGNASWIKGRKMGSDWGKRTQFKPGQPARNFMPIGSLRIQSGGYLQIKLSATGYPPKDWVMYHRHVWEQAHGPIPAGHVVRFKKGRHSTDPAAITPDALELVSREQHALTNGMHDIPPEVREVIQLRGAITRQINLQDKGAKA